jgi:hypothetical protein
MATALSLQFEAEGLREPQKVGESKVALSLEYCSP